MNKFFIAGIVLLIFFLTLLLLNLPFEWALRSAVILKSPSICNVINREKSFGDYSISIQRTKELCHSQYAIETLDLNYCLSLKTASESAGEVSQRDVCIKGLAIKLKSPDLCNHLESGKYIDTRDIAVNLCRQSASK